MTAPHVRPRVLFSRCLEGDPCRYDGGLIAAPFVGRLRAHVEAVELCPEVGIGLGVPRAPIRLVTQGEDVRLIQPSTSRDLTAEMQSFTQRTLVTLPTLDGVILKSRSPSCGLGDTKRFDDADADAPIGRGDGLFAEGVRATLGPIAISDEVQLDEPDHRRAFLARLFTLARLREPSAQSDHAQLTRALRHLLYRAPTYHRQTLEVASERTACRETLRAIKAALTAGPCEAADVPPPYPVALDT